MATKSKTKKGPDKIILGIFAALLLTGIVALISASIPESRADYGNIYGYFLHQLIFGIGLGLLSGFIVYKIPYKYFQKYAVLIFIAALALMILVFIPSVAVQSGGAQRWINLGFATFQPSAFIKLAFIIYLGAWLSSRKKDMENTQTLFPLLIFLGILTLLLMLQPDLSTLGIVVAITLAMIFAAGVPMRMLATIGAAGAAAFYAFIQISSYRMNRILTLFRPSSDPLGIGYQINQILIAVGAGGLFGRGPLQGNQKEFIPLPMNDSIYAVWAEETGFIGASILIVLFLLLAWRGLYVAKNAKSSFAKYTAIGITTWIFIQAMVNISAILGVFPLTGVTLPFISYGSSSMVVTMMGAGLLLQLSKET